MAPASRSNSVEVMKPSRSDPSPSVIVLSVPAAARTSRRQDAHMTRVPLGTSNSAVVSLAVRSAGGNFLRCTEITDSPSGSSRGAASPLLSRLDRELLHGATLKHGHEFGLSARIARVQTHLVSRRRARVNALEEFQEVTAEVRLRLNIKRSAPDRGCIARVAE